MIDFFIPFIVEPKQTKGNRIVTTASGRTFAARYTPAKTRKNADALTLLVAQHRPNKPLEGPLSMDVVFQYPWRAATPAKRRLTAKLKDTRPDWDNCCKQLCDVLQHAGFYANDSQLADVHVRKLWTDSPGVQVRIRECGE